MIGPDLCTRSRRLNARITGEPCMLCTSAAARRGGWRLMRVLIDLWFFAYHGEAWGHCRRARAWDRLHGRTDSAEACEMTSAYDCDAVRTGEALERDL